MLSLHTKKRQSFLFMWTARKLRAEFTPVQQANRPVHLEYSPTPLHPSPRGHTVTVPQAPGEAEDPEILTITPARPMSAKFKKS